jgi:hypothetical protein
MTIADSLNQLKMQMKTELTERQNEFLMYGYGIVPILSHFQYSYCVNTNFHGKKREKFSSHQDIASPKSIK